MDLSNVPKVVLENIFVFLPNKDLHNCCLVEKKWNNIIQASNKIWKNIFFEIINEDMMVKNRLTEENWEILKLLSKEYRLNNGELDYKKLVGLVGKNIYHKS